MKRTTTTSFEGPTLRIEPVKRNMIRVKSYTDEIPTKSKQEKIIVSIAAGEGGSISIRIDFPRLSDKDRKEALNIISIDTDGSMSAKQCVAEDCTL